VSEVASFLDEYLRCEKLALEFFGNSARKAAGHPSPTRGVLSERIEI
jgi:hypothetical protein